MTRGQVLKLIGGLFIVLVVVIFIVAIGSCRGGADTGEDRLQESTSSVRLHAPPLATETA